MDFKSSIKYYIIAPILFIIGVKSPLLFLGKDAFIYINDNLDCDFNYLTILKNSGYLLTTDLSVTIDSVGSNLPLYFFHSPFNIFKINYVLLDSYYAYILNSLLISIIGFFSFFLLIRDYYPKVNHLSNSILSLSFSLIPTYSIYGLSVLGLPLLLWSFFNLFHQKKLKISFLLISIFPLFVFFHFSIPFYLFYLFVSIIYLKFYKKKPVVNLFLGFIVLLITGVIFNFNLLESLLQQGGLKSARSLPIKLDHPSFLGGAYLFVKTLLFGTFETKFISIPILLYSLFNFKNSFNTKVVYTFIFFNIGMLCMFTFYTNYTSLLLGSFNFSRFYILNTFLFYLALISKEIINQRIIILTSTILVFLNLIRNQEFIYNLPGLNQKHVNYLYSEDYTMKKILNKPPDVNLESFVHVKGFYSFNEYYSVELFNYIKEAISINESSKIVSIGISPSVSQYNKIKTLDGYLVNYPIDLKETFEKINRGPIQANGLYVSNEQLINVCGSRCNKYNAPSHIDITNINIEVLKQNGVSHIFSISEITNSGELKLDFLGSFENNKSPYKIFTYKLKV